MASTSTSPTVELPRVERFATRPPSRVARQVLTAFLLTFVAARLLVFLIMSRRLPDLYLHLGGTHVHHLNYGIFLLTAVGAAPLFRQPVGKWLTGLTLAYGVALGLTFDEFGMWIHLGGGYWQRASFDAIVVIAATLGLIASAPAIRRMTRRRWLVAALLAVATAFFWAGLARSLAYAKQDIGSRLQRLDRGGPE